MHWRASLAIWLLISFFRFTTAQDVVRTNSLSSPTGTSPHDNPTTTGPVLASAHELAAATSDSKDVKGGGTPVDSITTPSTSSDPPSSTSTSSTVHRPQVITTVAGGSTRRVSGALSHSRTITGAHTTFTVTPHPRPHPVPIPDPPLSSGSSPAMKHRQSVASIVFEIIGGLAGFLIVACCGRCLYKYKRTPRRDRIANVVDRHLLERELAEMEEARPRIRRNSVVRPPPPPYQRAPEYDDAIRPTTDHPP